MNRYGRRQWLQNFSLGFPKAPVNTDLTPGVNGLGRLPPVFQVSSTHWAATWLLHPDAPKVEPPVIVTDRIQRMQKAQAEREAKAAVKGDADA